MVSSQTSKEVHTFLLEMIKNGCESEISIQEHGVLRTWANANTAVFAHARAPECQFAYAFA